MSERLQEISAYILSWRGKPRQQAIEEIASYSLETKRIPDPYYFIVEDNGKLRSPQTGKLVEKSIEKDSYLGQKEWQAFQKIQEWNVGETAGLVFWISPPHSERSGLTKLVVSEIIGEKNDRRLFNRAILLDMSGRDCLNFARNIQENGVLFDSPEDLRSNPIFLNGRAEHEWLTYLELNAHDTNAWQMIRKGQDLIEKDNALREAPYVYDKILAGETGYDDDFLFGSSPVSCPPNIQTAFETFYTNSFQVEGNFVENCGNCGKRIGKVIGKGYRCACGGTYEGC